jgi:hypothetical protein
MDSNEELILHLERFLFALRLKRAFKKAFKA